MRNPIEVVQKHKKGWAKKQFITISVRDVVSISVALADKIKAEKWKYIRLIVDEDGKSIWICESTPKHQNSFPITYPKAGNALIYSTAINKILQRFEVELPEWYYFSEEKYTDKDGIIWHQLKKQ